MPGEQHVSFTSGKVEGKTYDGATDFGEALKAAFNAHYKEAMLASGGLVAAVAELPGIKLHLAGIFDAKHRPSGKVSVAVGQKQSEMSVPRDQSATPKYLASA